MTCADISERIVDHLYGELNDADQRTFAAHLEGCENCRRETAALQRTLGEARAAFKGPLAEEPPARVRATVMAAAVEGARQARAAAAEQSGGFWAWLRRPWFLPAMGAASVIAVYFFVRPALQPAMEARMPSPSVTSESAPVETAAPAPPPPSARPVVAEHAPAATPPPLAEAPRGSADRSGAWPLEKAPRPRPVALAPGSGKGNASGNAKGTGDLASASAKPAAVARKRGSDPFAKHKAAAEEDGLVATGEGAAAAREARPGRVMSADPGWAQPPPAMPAKPSTVATPPADRPARVARGNDLDDVRLDGARGAGVGQGSLGGVGRAAGAKTDRLAPKKEREEYAEIERAIEERKEAPKAVRADQTAERPATRVAAQAPAPPPAPPAASAAGPRPSPVAAAAPAPAAQEPEQTRAPARRTYAQPPPRSPPAAPTEARPEPPAPASAPARDEESQQRGDRGKDADTADKNTNAVDEMSRRADRLFIEGRYAEAAAVYKELLRLHPAHKSVPRWRQRMDAAANKAAAPAPRR